MKTLEPTRIASMFLGILAAEGIRPLTENQTKTITDKFLAEYDNEVNTLDRKHPSIIARFLLAKGMTKKAVAQILKKDSSDITGMLGYRTILGDPNGKENHTQDSLKKNNKYLNLTWTRDEFEELAGKNPDWNLDAVADKLVPEIAEEKRMADEAKEAELEAAQA
jgi:hypothetical protein